MWISSVVGDHPEAELSALTGSDGNCKENEGDIIALVTTFLTNSVID